MNKASSIMLVEDELSMRIGMQHTLSEAGYAVAAFEEAHGALRAMHSESCDLLITDLRLPGMSGMELLGQVNELFPKTGVVLITAFPEVELAVQAMRLGAFDFICKPFSNDALLIAVERFFNFRKIKQENTRLKACKGLDEMVGGAAMQPVFERIRAIADSDVPVLVRGASGTGKELVADALHNLSARREKPFIKINCAALPEHLLESELFGHEKGAFTGAYKNRFGKFEVADGGTLFFDEAGDMPLYMQAKLLRVLEESVVTRVGGNVPVKVDVRAIFATAKNIEEAVDAGTFRKDFYYRINVVPIYLPKLRERGDDVNLLLQHFLHMYSEHHGKTGLTISQQALEALLAYEYPGNVRELRNIVQRIVLLSQEGTVRLGHLPQRVRENSPDFMPPLAEENSSLEEGVRRYERQRIYQALAEANGKKQQAAVILGVSRKVLWKKMKDLNMAGPSEEH